MVIRLRPHYWLSVSRLCLAVACLGILQTKNAPGAEEFRLVKRAVKIAERGEVIGYTLLVESNKFSFLPPLNWQVRGSPSEKQVVFLPRDLIASISLKVLPTQVATNAGLHPDQVRQLALDRYPDAKVRGQFTCVVNGGPGEAIDLERVGGNETLVLTRLAYLPVPGGLVEFNLTAPSRKFADYQFTFGNLLTTFRSESCPPPQAIIATQASEERTDVKTLQ